MVYEQMNINVVTTLDCEFDIPRDIYPNEIIYFKLGFDLESTNQNNERLHF